MKIKIKKILFLTLIIIFSFSKNSFAIENNSINKVEAEIKESIMYSYSTKRFEKVKIAVVDLENLTLGYNEIYSDAKNSVSLFISLPDNNLDMQAIYDDGWSGGSLPSTADIRPQKTAFGNYRISYTLSWQNDSIASIHSLDYRMPLMTVTGASTNIISPVATKYGYASGIGNVDYNATQAGVVVGSYNWFLRTDINSNNQVRLVWNDVNN